MTRVKQILQAMRAEHIPEGESGLWKVRRECLDARRADILSWQAERSIEPGTYTYLHRVTWASAHLHSDVVMEDTRTELLKHMDFCLYAHGRVLVCGLGLGCVVRGLLVDDTVEHVTVIERERDVLKLVAPSFSGEERVEIIHADALEWAESSQGWWDFAWHDLWSDPDTNEQHLQVIHGKLIKALVRRARVQGAWGFPRYLRRFANRKRAGAMI